MSFSARASFSAGAVLIGIGRALLLACALDFEAGSTGVYQILASKPNRGADRKSVV